MTSEADEPVTIPLDARRWAEHQRWATEGSATARAMQVRRARRNDQMLPEESTLLPTSGVWVCHGIVEFGDFTEEEINAGWPDEAIARECPPQPVVGWRVTNAPRDMSESVPPNIVLPDDEYHGDSTDAAFGDSPSSAIAEARRCLRKNRELGLEMDQQCAESGHRHASVRQNPEVAHCSCGDRRVVFVEREDVPRG